MKKLIRDKIPELIEDKSRLSQETDPNRIREYVAAKVLEEAQEVSEALMRGSHADAIEELADLQEVIYKACSVFGVNPVDLYTVMQGKGILKGGFDDNWILEIEE